MPSITYLILRSVERRVSKDAGLSCRQSIETDPTGEPRLSRNLKRALPGNSTHAILFSLCSFSSSIGHLQAERAPRRPRLEGDCQRTPAIGERPQPQYHHAPVFFLLLTGARPR